MAPSSTPKTPKKGPLTHSNSQEGTRLKNFKLGEVLGKGSAGTVYKSLNMDTGDVVAIKQVPLRNIPKEDIGKIMREIHLMNHLDHENIVKYMDSVKTKDHLNIVLEFVENGSLANTIKRFGSLPESLIAIYIEQVLQGLCYLHSQGVIHRDIKGANILTTKEGHVKLADFGVARRLGEAAEGKAARGQDDVAGTPYWMAPEVIEMSPASTASDIWGVGATIIELLTGSPPYFGLAALPALFKIVQDPHPPLPDSISPALRDFLLQCFRKDPGTRLTARKLLEHQWIMTSVAKRMEKAVGQDWSAVVERTLELHEAARKERKGRARVGYLHGAGVRSRKEAERGRSARRGEGDGSMRNSGSEGHAMAGSQGAERKKGTKGNQGTMMAGEVEEAAHNPQGWNNFAGKVEAALSEESDHTEGSHFDLGGSSEEDGVAGGGMRSRDLGEYAEEEGDDGGMRDVVLPLGSPAVVGRSASKQKGPLGAMIPMSKEGARRGLKLGKVEAKLSMYAESNENDRDLSAFELDIDGSFGRLGSQGHLQSLLRRRLSYVRGGHEEDEETSELELFDDEDESELTLGHMSPEHAAIESELLALMARLDPDGDEEEQGMACQQIEHLVRENQEGKKSIMVHNQILPLMEMLDCPSPSVVLRVLRVVLEVMTDRKRNNARVGGEGKYSGAIGVSEPIVERMCTVGLIHRLLHHTNVTGAGDDVEAWKMVQQQAALVLHSVCWGRKPALVQMIVACQGIPALVGLLSAEEPVNHVAFDCLWAITLLPAPTTKMDVCRLLARAKASPPLAKLLETAVMEGARGVGAGGGSVGGWVNLAWQQADRVSNLLVLFSQGDHVVKGDLSDTSVLSTLLSVVERGYETLPPIVQKAYLKILQCLRHLSGETAALEPLQRAGACRILVPFISGVARAQGMKAFSREVQSQAMFAIYNLCKVNKERQEQAARAGLVPHAQLLASMDGPLRQLAVPILCDLAHAGRDARAELWRHGAVMTFIQILEHPYWQSISLNAMATWLTTEHDATFLEDELLKPECVDAVVDCIDLSETATMASLLTPLLRILQSERLNKIYGETKLVSGLLLRMKHPEAVVRKMILECVQSMYAVSIDPRAFIMAHELIEVVETLVREDESRLVQEQGKLLLRAMYINVVL